MVLLKGLIELLLKMFITCYTLHQQPMLSTRFWVEVVNTSTYFKAKNLHKSLNQMILEGKWIGKKTLCLKHL
jgi:hypothetical protein